MNKKMSLSKRINAFIYDSSIDIKDRTYVLFSFMYFAALVAASLVGLALHEPLSSVLLSVVIVIISNIALYLIVKLHKIGPAKIAVSFLMVFVFQPAMFFLKGGVGCGNLFSLLLGTYYLVLVLEGKFRIVMCAIDTVVLTALWIIGYMRPDLITEYSVEANYIYSFAKFVIVVLVLTAIITFQTRIYQRENKIAEEKSMELEEMNRSQNRFFSSMSHEIRTPINTVLGLNEIILRQEDASEEIIKDARNIQGAGRMLLALINDILDISKIEAGKMDIVPVNYSVSSLLSEIVNMMWLKAEEKGLKFNVDIDPNVPETLFGDEVRIKQVLINLLNNAVKYTPEGSVSLHMECDSQETGDVLLKINVSDTGMGIKAEALPHLFDSFQRQDEEKNRHIEGTGLGLSIVKQLVELMNGDITVNSVYGEGSVFAVSLKQGVSGDRHIGDMNITSVGRAEREKFEHSFHAPTARILIVDDNEMNLQVEQKLLDGTEITVDLAMSGAEALGLTLRNRYDVVFMDHLMPEMDGIECFEQIRSQKGGLNTDVPIIVLTANAGGENIELYNNTGFDGYLVKPVSGRQLEDMLIEHLPPEKLIMSDDSEMTGTQMNTTSRYAKKKPIAIAATSMADLPAQIIKKLQIAIIPCKVMTNEGVFFDNVDIDSEELVRYMYDRTKMVDSEPPTEEELSMFFAQELKKAHHLIFITLTTGSSREYVRAVRVAQSFDNVSVVNSETLSSSTGILVMIAARLASQGMPVDKIVDELEEAKHFIRTSFVVKNTDIMARRNRISPMMNSLLNSLWLRPVLRMKDDKLGVGRFMFGSEQKCYEKYIKHALPANVGADRSFVFITYAGMTEEELLWVENLVKKRLNFDHVIFQKASAGISSNCGEGTFGLLYLIEGNRNYHLGSFFEDMDADYAEIDSYEEDETEDIDELNSDNSTGDTENSSTDAVENAYADKWYGSIPGIDPAAALKNSGSEDAFLSVAKIYYDTYGAKSEEIQRYYDAGDWENYKIKVHALKSSSRLVGALKLGEAAEALEMAGKDSDIEFIAKNHDALMQDYRIIKEALAPIFGVSDDLPDIPADMLADAYGGLSEFAQAKDFELANMVMESVREYKLPPDDEERFTKIRNALSKMDWDEISAIISEVL
ncbi:MAG: DegV family EDD domain-containing protein [Lachnospiraceae bacterium]|nr:DegV family EDD domain-containing protein [Lachnospiraceae bacterium]